MNGMKRKILIYVLIMVLCAVAFYVAGTGRVFGAFIDHFVPCIDAPGSSFPCYGVYDIALMISSVVLGVICLGALLWGVIRSKVKP